MKTLFLLTALICLKLPIIAQKSPSKITTEENLMNIANPVASGTAFVTNMNALYEGVKGSLYYSEEWATGDVILKNGSPINEIKLRYNIHKDELEYLNSTSHAVFVIQKQKIKGFKLTDSISKELVFEQLQLQPGKDASSAFVQVLYSGDTKLLLKYGKNFIKADFKGAYATGNKYDEYVDEKQYYLVKSDGSIYKVKLVKNSILKVLKDKEKLLEIYASENRIDFTKTEQVAALLKYYNSIE